MTDEHIARIAAYVPANIRRRQKQLAAVERENIHLRQRLSEMYRALAVAHTQLAAISQWEALINREATNLQNAVRIAIAKTDPHQLLPAIRKEQGFIDAEACAENRHPLYIGDRCYSLPLRDEVETRRPQAHGDE